MERLPRFDAHCRATRVLAWPPLRLRHPPIARCLFGADASWESGKRLAPSREAPLTHMHRSVEPDDPELLWRANTGSAGGCTRGCIATRAPGSAHKTRSAAALGAKASDRPTRKGAIATRTNVRAWEGGLLRRSRMADGNCRGGRPVCAGCSKLGRVRAAHERAKASLKPCRQRRSGAVQYAEMTVRTRRHQRPALRACGPVRARSGTPAAKKPLRMERIFANRSVVIDPAAFSQTPKRSDCAFELSKCEAPGSPFAFCRAYNHVSAA